MVRDEPLSVELVVAGEMLCIRVDGELDMSTTHLVDRCAAEVRQDGAGGQDMVLDLRRVTFCDAAGLRALARVRASAAARGIACELWPSRAVRRIVCATGCRELLDGRR